MPRCFYEWHTEMAFRKRRQHFLVAADVVLVDAEAVRR